MGKTVSKRLEQSARAAATPDAVGKARKLYVDLFGDLLRFAGPVTRYPVPQHGDSIAKAWQRTGSHIRRAMQKAHG